MTSMMLTREAREIFTKREVFPVLEVLFVYSVKHWVSTVSTVTENRNVLGHQKYLDIKRKIKVLDGAWRL